MMRLSRTVLLLALALAAGARAAAAQTIPSPYDYIEKTQATGLFAGYLFTDPDVSITDSTSLPLGPQSGPVFGIRYQLRAAGPLSIDASVGVSPTERRLFGTTTDTDSAFTGAVDLETTVPATVLMADVGLRFYVTGPRTWNGLAPFVVGTGGMVGDIQRHLRQGSGCRRRGALPLRPLVCGGGGARDRLVPRPQRFAPRRGHGPAVADEDARRLSATGANERSEWNPAVGITVGGAMHF